MRKLLFCVAVAGLLVGCASQRTGYVGYFPLSYVDGCYATYGCFHPLAGTDYYYFYYPSPADPARLQIALIQRPPAPRTIPSRSDMVWSDGRSSRSGGSSSPASPPARSSAAPVSPPPAPRVVTRS